jgi:tetratricopeptide (TPR) repeat protein
MAGPDDTVRDLATGETVVASEPQAAAAPQAARGAQIGRFVVLGTLGAGGMGTVYSAYDPKLDRKVAIKVLNAEAASEDAQTRLLREAQAMAKIRHPNVIVVHEVGTVGDQVYVAMEFADGGTLRAWLATKHTQREILDVFVQAGRGLAAAHAAGLVHRDFKPDNVLLSSDGAVRVTDFGLVGMLSSPATTTPAASTRYDAPVDTGPTPLTADLTQTGAVMGTPRYMAPEQFRGITATERTDQFAFCVALYEALYGERPFAGTSYAELCANVVTGAMQPPPKGAHVPGRLRRVLLRGLSIDPAARFPSMSELLAVLARDPAKQRLVIGGGVLALCAVGAIAALASRHAARGEECGDGSERVAAVWNPERRAAMTSAFAASQRPLAASIAERGAALVDDWMNRWRQGYLGACQATHVRHEQSDHLLDLRMQCLDGKLAETRATIDLATKGGADVVDHALEAFNDLPALSGCADRDSLLAEVPPPVEAARAQVTAVRSQLAISRGSYRLARYREAVAQASQALEAARASGYEQAIADAQTQLGLAQFAAGDPMASQATLHEAMQHAARAGDTALMLTAITELIRVLATETKQLDVADELAGLADAMAARAKLASEPAIELQLSIGIVERERTRIDAAQNRLERTLATAEKELGPEHGVTLAVVEELDNVYRDRARFADAHRLDDRLLASREKLYGADHPAFAAALRLAASTYRREGKYEEARKNIERALVIDRAALGPDHPDVGEALVTLGNVADDVADYQTALADYQQAAAIFEKAHSNRTEAVAAAIGGALSSLGRYDEAIAALERASSESERVHGPGSGIQRDLLNNLALAQLARGNLDEAAENLRRAREISAAIAGEDSADVVDIDINRANVMKKQHHPADAIALLQRTVPLAQKAYGATHPNVGMLHANLAMSLDDQKQPAAALAEFEQALPIFEQNFGASHVYTMQTVVQIAQTLDELERYSEALPYYDRALAIIDKLGADPKLRSEVVKERDQDRRRSHH